MSPHLVGSPLWKGPVALCGTGLNGAAEHRCGTRELGLGEGGSQHRGSAEGRIWGLLGPPLKDGRAGGPGESGLSHTDRPLTSRQVGGRDTLVPTVGMRSGRRQGPGLVPSVRLSLGVRGANWGVLRPVTAPATPPPPSHPHQSGEDGGGPLGLPHVNPQPSSGQCRPGGGRCPRGPESAVITGSGRAHPWLQLPFSPESRFLEFPPGASSLLTWPGL